MIRPLLKPILCLLVSTLFAHAQDTYVLKNGDRLVGNLIRETDSTYHVEVRLAPTIKEERVVAKDRVLRIIKPDLGNIEFEQLRNLVPVPDGLKINEYKQRIEQVSQFIERHPSNQYVRKAIAMRDELEDELRDVEDGAVKIDGVLYPPTEIRGNAYEFDARIAARKIKELAVSGNHLQALRSYKQFQEDFTYTKIHLEMLPLMRKLIQLHAGRATEMKNTLDDRIAAREAGLDRMAQGDRNASMVAIRQEEERLNRLYRNEIAAKIGWVTLHPFSKQSHDATIRYATAELLKLERLTSRDFTDLGVEYRELFKLEQQGADERAMKEKIRICHKWRMPKRYLEKFDLANGGR